MAHYQQLHMIKDWSAKTPSLWTAAWKHWTGQRKIWRQRAVERKELARATARDLADIGMSVGQAQFEINKPFWRA